MGSRLAHFLVKLRSSQCPVTRDKCASVKQGVHIDFGKGKAGPQGDSETPGVLIFRFTIFSLKLCFRAKSKLT